jgi:cyclohexanone monooxygenase
MSGRHRRHLYWNRYPRAAIPTLHHCYTFDKLLLQEWSGPALPRAAEILRYLEYVAKRHDLKRDMQFSTRVIGGEFDEETNLWKVRTDKGDRSLRGI